MICFDVQLCECGSALWVCVLVWAGQEEEKQKKCGFVGDCGWLERVAQL